MDINTCREVAARVWCDPAFSHVVMDVGLCEYIAQHLLSVAGGNAPPPVPEWAGCPDDIREAGWAVAVHNDYRLSGALHTFWLFTKDGRCAQGEGRTDGVALNLIRDEVGLPRR